MRVGPGHVIGGRYRAVEPLGAGGMGSVWRARHTELDVDMAIKVMSGELAGSATAAERFKREARAAAMLRSPHVVHLHDYGVEHGHPYMVMELLAGEDLRSFIRREAPVDLRRAASIVLPVCKALRVAHQAGIIHRDIKPANIFLARSSDEEQVKVLDFGIAKAQRDPEARGETTSRQVLGSPMYMSPEQARGASIDARSDLWSLAVVAYELVVGKQPFRGATLGDVFARICSDDVPLPSAAGVSAPGLDELFQRALARAPADRFPTADAFADAFAALAGVGEPLRTGSGATALAQREATTRDAISTTAMPTPLSVVVPVASPPQRRGRESDTLALAATSPERTLVDVPPAPHAAPRRARVIVGAGAAAAVVALLAVALPRLSAPPAAPSDAAGGSAQTVDPVAPTPVPHAPLPPVVEPSPSPPSAVATAAPSVAAGLPPRKPAASPVQRPAALRPAAAATAAPIAPGVAATATATPAAEPRRDPVFGVPVTQP